MTAGKIKINIFSKKAKVSRELFMKTIVLFESKIFRQILLHQDDIKWLLKPITLHLLETVIIISL